MKAYEYGCVVDDYSYHDGTVIVRDGEDPATALQRKHAGSTISEVKIGKEICVDALVVGDLTVGELITIIKEVN